MAQPVLHRFDTVVYRNKSANDDSQVPAAFARIDFFRQGATVSGTANLQQGDSDLYVYAQGDLAVGSTVQVGPGCPIVTVIAVDTSVWPVKVAPLRFP